MLETLVIALVLKRLYTGPCRIGEESCVLVLEALSVLIL
jgi:hypothetical protein